MKKFLVIGLGALGTSLSRSLVAKGAEVVAVDHDMRRVEEMKDQVTFASRLDVTDEEALRSLDVETFDAVVVCIGEDFQSNLLASVMLQQLGAKRIITRATDAIHKKILKALGMGRIVSPEEEAGEQLAFSLMFSQVENVIRLVGELDVVMLRAGERFDGRTVQDLGLDADEEVCLVAIHSPPPAEEGEAAGEEAAVPVSEQGDTEAGTVALAPGPETVVHARDLLVLAGDARHLRKVWRAAE